MRRSSATRPDQSTRRADRRNVCHLVVQRLGDEADPAIVHRVHGRQRTDVVPLPMFRAADLER